LPIPTGNWQPEGPPVRQGEPFQGQYVEFWLNFEALFDIQNGGFTEAKTTFCQF
jgi:hypothetical protein